MSKKTSKQQIAKFARNARQSLEYWSEASLLSFNEELLRSIERAGITQSEFARRLAVSEAYISKVLKGNVNLTVETMNKLGLAVGVSLRVHLAPCDQVTRWMDVTSVSSFILNEEESDAINPTTHSIPFQVRNHSAFLAVSELEVN